LTGYSNYISKIQNVSHSWSLVYEQPSYPQQNLIRAQHYFATAAADERAHECYVVEVNETVTFRQQYVGVLGRRLSLAGEARLINGQIIRLASDTYQDRITRNLDLHTDASTASDNHVTF